MPIATGSTGTLNQVASFLFMIPLMTLSVRGGSWLPFKEVRDKEGGEQRAARTQRQTSLLGSKRHRRPLRHSGQPRTQGAGQRPPQFSPLLSLADAGAKQKERTLTPKKKRERREKEQIKHFGSLSSVPWLAPETPVAKKPTNANTTFLVC